MADRFSNAFGTRRGSAGSAVVRVPERAQLIATVIAQSEHIPGIFSNPGTGSVLLYGDSVSMRDARANVAALLEDVGPELQLVSASETADASGRYRFVLAREDGTERVVEMPGLPLSLVRYQQDRASALAFPRLYLDGSSRWWPFAVSELCGFAAGED